MEKFLRDEIYKDSYEAILEFILSPHIRSGEFEGNEHIIKKMDQCNYIIFVEYPDKDMTAREIHNAFAIFRNDLIKGINRYAKKINIDISKYENFEQDYSLQYYYN